MSWTGYSPDFQDAYDRRFKHRVESEPIFDKWVEEFGIWINQSNISKGIKQRRFVTDNQIKALAYNAKQEGLQNISIKAMVRDKRTRLGYRMIYRDVTTGQFAKNPYREIQ